MTPEEIEAAFQAFKGEVALWDSGRSLAGCWVCRRSADGQRERQFYQDEEEATSAVIRVGLVAAFEAVRNP